MRKWLVEVLPKAWRPAKPGQFLEVDASSKMEAADKASQTLGYPDQFWDDHYIDAVPIE